MTNQKKLLTVQEYLEIEKKYIENKYDESFDFEKEFYSQMPEYLISICPFCFFSKRYIEKINTYTLNKYCGGNWNNYRVDHKINWSDKKMCRHFFFFDYFLNFNGFNPSLKEHNRQSSQHPEKPHVMGCLFTEPYHGCKVVMQSLPIHKIVGNQFEPRYTLYILTYYTTYFARAKELKKLDKNNDEIDTAPPSDDVSDPESWWDLKRWVKEDKLYWLSGYDLNAKLMKKDLSKFPYGDIKGRYKPYWGSLPNPPKEE